MSGHPVKESMMIDLRYRYIVIDSYSRERNPYSFKEDHCIILMHKSHGICCKQCPESSLSWDEFGKGHDTQKRFHVEFGCKQASADLRLHQSFKGPNFVAPALFCVAIFMILCGSSNLSSVQKCKTVDWWVYGVTRNPCIPVNIRGLSQIHNLGNPLNQPLKRDIKGWRFGRATRNRMAALLAIRYLFFWQVPKPMERFLDRNFQVFNCSVYLLHSDKLWQSYEWLHATGLLTESCLGCKVDPEWKLGIEEQVAEFRKLWVLYSHVFDFLRRMGVSLKAQYLDVGRSGDFNGPSVFRKVFVGFGAQAGSKGLQSWPCKNWKQNRCA